MSHHNFQYLNGMRNARCPTCNGTGSELVMGEETCGHCAGTGRDTKSDLWAEPCNRCNGTGRVSYCRRDHRYPCRTCHGSGTVSY